MERSSWGQYNVTAAYHDMAGARKGVEALERHGVEVDDISLLGRAAEEAVAPETRGERDDKFMDQTRNVGVGGGLAGAGAGGTLGFLAGIAAFGIPGVGPVVGGGILAMVAGGAVAGAGVGITAAAMTRMKQSEAWEATYASVEAGEVVVAMHTANEAEFERAYKVLEGSGTDELHAFDAEGTPLDHGAHALDEHGRQRESGGPAE